MPAKAEAARFNGFPSKGPITEGGMGSPMASPPYRTHGKRPFQEDNEGTTGAIRTRCRLQ